MRSDRHRFVLLLPIADHQHVGVAADRRGVADLLADRLGAVVDGNADAFFAQLLEGAAAVVVVAGGGRGGGRPPPPPPQPRGGGGGARPEPRRAPPPAPPGAAGPPPP